MISDEPDEDADLLDDDALIEAATGPINQPSIQSNTATPSDWPPRARQGEPLTVDDDIQAWFQSRETDWRSAARAVLRAWIAAHARPGR
jgi:uncharacterized protein (DUF4415 family)